MAFIANKKLGDEREEKLAELYNIETPFGKPSVSWGAYDEGRDAVFFPLGGRGGFSDDIPRYSVLIWKKNVIKTEDFRSFPEVRQYGKIESWKITKIEIPTCLKDNSCEIIEMIKEAFITRDKELLPLAKVKYQFEHIAKPTFY